MDKQTKKFIAMNEASCYLGIDDKLLTKYAEASGAIYKIGRFRMIKISELEAYMKHYTTVGSSKRLIQRKFVRVSEARIIYSLGRDKVIEIAKAAGAVYRVNEGDSCPILIRLDLFDEYFEKFRNTESNNDYLMEEISNGI